MAMADFLKALASVEDETVHGVVGAFMTADAVAHQAFGKSPIYFDAGRVQRLAATMLTYFGGDPLGRPPIETQPEKPEGNGQETKGNAAGAERPQADLGGAGAGGGPAPATERPAGIVSTIEADTASLAHKALDIGEEGMHAIAEALGRTEPEHPPATRIAGS